MPDRIRTGSTPELVNDSQIEVHELVAVRLPDGEDRPVSELVQLPPDELGSFFEAAEYKGAVNPNDDWTAANWISYFQN